MRMGFKQVFMDGKCLGDGMGIQSIAILGAGQMGNGIAQVAACAGYDVTMIDINQDYLDNGMVAIKNSLSRVVKKERMKQDEADFAIAKISTSTDKNAASSADLVIEAIPEIPELKFSTFSELDEICKPDAILASNTSGLDIDSIASVTSRPDKIVGTHFFSPANIMRLLEVVRGEQTSNETLATIMAIGKKLKKAAVVSLNAPGFIGNRMLFGYTAQANMLLLEGALPHQIDQALESFGLNMGPFRMMDLVGLDLGWRARKLSGKESPLHAKIGDELCEQNRYGQKSGAGYYNYSEGSRAPNPAPENEATYEKISSENGFTRRDITDEEIVDRCILALINEGADILSEGVAQRAADIDVVYINGYGFPIWRGGPMHHANALGLDVVIEKLEKYKEITGSDVYKPSEMLLKLAKDGLKLGEAPSKEDRKEKLGFEMSSVANNF